MKYEMNTVCFRIKWITYLPGFLEIKKNSIFGRPSNEKSRKSVQWYGNDVCNEPLCMHNMRSRGTSCRA